MKEDWKGFPLYLKAAILLFWGVQLLMLADMFRG